MSLAFVPGRAAQGNAVIKRHIVANLGGLADDHAHAVVDEEAPAYGRAGMDLDAGEEASEMRYQPAEPAQVHAPQPIRDAVNAQSMKTRIAGDDLPRGARGGVAVEYAGDVFTDAVEHKLVW